MEIRWWTIRESHQALPLVGPKEEKSCSESYRNFSMVQYMERCGGFANAKDLGIVQYALNFVADSAMRSDWEGVREHLSLAMLAIEQAAQDGGRWDLAFNLLLLEDPPMDVSPKYHGGSDRQIQSILCSMPSTNGNSVVGIHEGNGLHSWSQTGDGEEVCPGSFTSPANPEAKEEGKVPQRTTRRTCRGGGLDCSPRDDDYAVDPSDPVPMSKWINLLLRSVLASKTPFAAFVSRSIHCNIDRSSMPVHTALFPIPLPLDDAWSGVPPRLGIQRRRRLALRKLVRLVIVALNYLHARAPFSVVPLLWRRPSSLHLRVYDRVAALCRAGGPPEVISIFGCGRKSCQLDARFRELRDAVKSLGIGSSMYHSGGAGKPVNE